MTTTLIGKGLPSYRLIEDDSFALLEDGSRRLNEGTIYMTIGSLFGINLETFGLYQKSFTWTVYKEAATQPAIPTGGSYDLVTDVGTPPTGWSNTTPTSPTLAVWKSITIVESRNTGFLTWSTAYV